MPDHATEGVVPSNRSRTRWQAVTTALGAALVAGLFDAACVCPAVRVGGCGFSLLGDWQEVHTGLTAALFGWFSPFILPWLANPVLLAGGLMFLQGKHRRAATLGGVAFALGLTPWVFMVEPNEILPPATGLSGLFVGYYLWLSSMAALVIGSVVAGAAVRGTREAWQRPDLASQPPGPR